ncbi:type I methionyl aminopeptidase [Dermacoccus nishinomiyaensis]|uniref:type I methionyl aminopeptidase n=1 Tax=Dermacoccus nishinomiyaensis TaxID=1274 RepID=UPI00093C6E31|nr:M24 family metallopeptidase [Dermacoccus nishinomiyaensis]
MFGRTRLDLKSSDDIRAMRRAGLVTGSALRASALGTRAGMTTKDVDAIAHAHMLERGATPSFLGYNGFPATLCISVNDEVVHGIPGERVLQDGDVVSLDCGAIVDGWHGDSALTFVVGAARDDASSAQRVAARHAGDEPAIRREGVVAWAQGDPRRALVLATEASMWAGIEALQVGERLNDVGEGVQDLLEEFNAPERLAGLPPETPSFEIVDGYTGHGVGRELHQDPTVYNEYVNERLPKVKPGLVVAVEPMVTLGTYETHALDDGWTVKTDDGSLAAHFEHTVAVTEKGLWVLTAQDGGRSRLEPLGLYGGLDD